MQHQATLSDDEFKIIGLIRKAHSDEIVKHSSSWRSEIEAAYNELEYVEPYNFEEVIDAVRNRLYGILY